MVLVCYSADRLARDTILEEVIRDKVARKRCKVTTVVCPTEETPEGILIRKVMGAFAEYRRVADGLLTKKRSRMHQARGLKMSKIPPFGHRDDPDLPGRLLPCPVEQAVCAKICDLAAQGQGTQRILRFLERERIPCRGKRVWNRKTIGRIIQRGREIK